jgi:hypothetical protein
MVVDAANKQTSSQAKSEDKDSSSQRSKKSGNPEARMSHWTYGIIDRLSSRSLIFIDGDSSDEDDSVDGHRFSQRSTLKAPSTQELDASSIQSPFMAELSHKTSETHLVNIPRRSDAQPRPNAIGHQTHMTNTFPITISSLNPNERGPQERASPPRPKHKRRASYEKTSNQDSAVTPMGAILRKKLPFVRSPTRPTRKAPSDQTFDPFSIRAASHGEHSHCSTIHKNTRSQASEFPPFLPPPSPRKATSGQGRSNHQPRSRSPRRKSRKNMSRKHYTS